MLSRLISRPLFNNCNNITKSWISSERIFSFQAKAYFSDFAKGVDVGFITMSNGKKLPRFGLGTFLASDREQLKTAIRASLDAGYRYIDTAALYENEDVIGEVLQEYYNAKKLKRSDLFLATKLPFYGHELTDHFVKKSLENLKTDYLDLYIIHMSFPCKADSKFKPLKDANGKFVPVLVPFIDTWRELEGYYKKGVFKSLGLSNFNKVQIEAIIDDAEIKPHNLQVEIHILFPQVELVNFCKSKNITVTAYAPLGSPGSIGFRTTSFKPEDDCLDHPLIQELSVKYQKTPAQILLRQIIQRGISTIPKSTNPKRIKENINIFDFEIDQHDMKRFKNEVTGCHRLFNFEFAEHHPWFALHENALEVDRTLQP